MRNFLSGLLVLLLASLSSAAAAGGLIYGGFGQAEDADETTTDDVPWVIGFLGFSDERKMVLGFDIAGEGTMLDSTYGQDSLSQALSYNLLVGANLSNNGTTRIDASAILGMRETFADCPDSFLGYQCYADRAPDTEYDFNYGVLLTVAHNRIAGGLRVTGESTQVVVGFRF